MTVTIDIPAEREAALITQARLRGLTVAQWLLQLADSAPDVEGPLQTAANTVLRRMRDLPAEAADNLPEDGASQHDHYTYGTLKREQ